MCGIGGFMTVGRLGQTEAALGETRIRLRHRGPDGEGQWLSSDGMAGFCHTRLAIVDLSTDANQPMLSQNGGCVLSFNGEIYNWKTLRAELIAAGWRLRTQSDSEILLVAWRAWGEGMLVRLRGMFAFAIYDIEQRILICARDRVGKKPFVYATGPGGFAFASEIPALMPLAAKVGADASLDHGAIATMLLHNLRHIPDPATAYRGLRRLRAGHAAVVRDGRIERMWRYWDVKADIARASARAAAGAAAVREVLEEAVELRRVADVPVGALLSGGTDSSAVTALAQRHSADPLRTYALGYDAEDEDLVRARFMAKRLGTVHREFYFDPAEQWFAFRTILSTYGEPIMLLPLVHAFQLCHAIRSDGLKVVLAGHGADELFYGYLGHIQTARLSRAVSALEVLQPLAALVPSQWRPRSITALAAPRGGRKAALYGQYAAKFRQHVRSGDGATEQVSEEMGLWGGAGPCDDYIDESNFVALMVENRHSVTIAADLPAMIAPVEVRAPFLDQEMIALAFALSWRSKLPADGDTTNLKAILKTAVSDIVPRELLYAPKRGFGYGIRERDVLLGPWRPIVDRAFELIPADYWLDARWTRRLWQSGKSGKPIDWSLLGRIFSILVWEQGLYRSDFVFSPSNGRAASLGFET
jgi:asparagine synthase (glutamine-hydrolysing)